ncbi:MAG: hypothetical protein ACLTDR_14320 [Adlercreutzia equolifaciens]
MANIWLFPYRVAQLGGAAFLIPYLILVALLGFTGVIGEMSFGRAMRWPHGRIRPRHGDARCAARRAHR